MANENELAVASTFKMPSVCDSHVELLDTEGIDFKLPTIRLPGANAGYFEFSGMGEDDDQDVVTKSEFLGVIIINKPYRAYYSKPFNGKEHALPDCCSFDASNGIGDPGCKCDNCAYNVFNAAGGGKPCKEKRRLLVLCEDSIYPYTMTLSTGSFKAFNIFFSRYAMRTRKDLSFIVVKFTLKNTRSSNGISYTHVHFSRERDLTDEEHKAVLKMRESYENAFTSAGNNNDVEGN